MDFIVDIFYPASFLRYKEMEEDTWKTRMYHYHHLAREYDRDYREREMQQVAAAHRFVEKWEIVWDKHCFRAL